jgi:hypothetical protein
VQDLLHFCVATSIDPRLHLPLPSQIKDCCVAHFKNGSPVRPFVVDSLITSSAFGPRMSCLRQAHMGCETPRADRGCRCGGREAHASRADHPSHRTTPAVHTLYASSGADPIPARLPPSLVALSSKLRLSLSLCLTLMAPPRAFLLFAASLWCLLAAQMPRPAAADDGGGPIVQTIFYYSPPPPSTPPGTGASPPSSTAAPPPPLCSCDYQPAPPQCDCAARPGNNNNNGFSPPHFYAFRSGSGRAQAADGLRLPLICAAAVAAVLAWR